MLIDWAIADLDLSAIQQGLPRRSIQTLTPTVTRHTTPASKPTHIPDTSMPPTQKLPPTGGLTRPPLQTVVPSLLRATLQLQPVATPPVQMFVIREMRMGALKVVLAGRIRML